MNTAAFVSAYNESRNGANRMIRHPLVRQFIMSDGVVDCADAGCWWLMDIIATEAPKQMAIADETLLVITVKAVKAVASIRATGRGDRLLKWRRNDINTDMPDGMWNFYLALDSENFVLILPSEY